MMNEFTITILFCILCVIGGFKMGKAKGILIGEINAKNSANERFAKLVMFLADHSDTKTNRRD